MTTYPAVEHPRRGPSGWLREHRLRIALAIGLLESVLVVASQIGWFWILGLAVLAVAFHVVLGRTAPFEFVRQLSWTATFSQLVAVLIPLLWGLVKFVAIIVLVLVALALVVVFLLDRR